MGCSCAFILFSDSASSWRQTDAPLHVLTFNTCRTKEYHLKKETKEVDVHIYKERRQKDLERERKRRRKKRICQGIIQYTMKTCHMKREAAQKNKYRKLGVLKRKFFESARKKKIIKWRGWKKSTREIQREERVKESEIVSEERGKKWDKRETEKERKKRRKQHESRIPENRYKAIFCEERKE